MVDCMTDDLAEKIRAVYSSFTDNNFKSVVEDLARNGSIDLLICLAEGKSIPSAGECWRIGEECQLAAIEALGGTKSKKALGKNLSNEIL